MLLVKKKKKNINQKLWSKIKLTLLLWEPADDGRLPGVFLVDGTPEGGGDILDSFVVSIGVPGREGY